MRMMLKLKHEYKIENLCMAGGVALKCVANGLIKKKLFKNFLVQPAAGDAGGALGAILCILVNSNDDMKGSYLGPSFNIREIKNFLILILFMKKVKC